MPRAFSASGPLQCFLGGLVFLILSTAGVLYWNKSSLPDEDAPPISTAVLSPMGPGGKRQWSKQMVHYPGFLLSAGLRGWSHWEIAQRHQALVLKELPEYITELRGAGHVEETDRTGAAWFGRVPMEKMAEFRQYMLELGVPEEALLEKKEVELPPEYRRDPEDWPVLAVPAEKLLFSTSVKSNGDTEITGMKFGKVNGTMAYYLANPNLRRAGVYIEVAWLTGNVQFLENPTNPYD